MSLHAHMLKDLRGSAKKAELESKPYRYDGVDGVVEQALEV
jgi:hypothetical protein